MRKLTESPFTVIEVLDEPGQGGACHEYQILSSPQTANETQALYGNVRFQNGSVKEFGVNGCHQEDLLAIVIDRLQSFQAGPFPCEENQAALEHCMEALFWLHERTRGRRRRGVEGVNKL